jgi:conserved hypothetical protein
MKSERAKNVAQLVLGISLIAVFLSITNPIEIYATVIRTNLATYVFGLAFFLLIYPIAALRWIKICPDHMIRVSSSLKTIAISYGLNKVLPFNSGDIARSKIMQNYTEVESHGELLGLVGLERVSDIVVLSATASISLITFLPASNVFFTALPIVLVISGMYSLRKFEELFIDLIDTLSPTLLFNVGEHLKDGLGSFNRVSLDKLLVVILLTSVRWLLNIVSFYIIISSAGMSLSIAQVAALTSLMSLVASLPITPAGLGAVEISATGLLISFGLSTAESGTVVLLTRSVGVLLMGIVGLVVLSLEGLELNQISHSSSPLFSE